MNAFWASENCDAFIVFCSFPSQENAPENSSQKWSSLKGSGHYIKTTERTALSYLVKPLTDQINRAMREE
ncbi:hypothetical protein NIBR502774_17870 (plasmid) [Rhizobium sp. NIBRBAC000502774]|nr:hypothetical protein NIBR502774_17870 [Rhizobium sp. NIBRBAC000502774]